MKNCCILKAITKMSKMLVFFFLSFPILLLFSFNFNQSHFCSTIQRNCYNTQLNNGSWCLLISLYFVVWTIRPSRSNDHNRSHPEFQLQRQHLPCGRNVRRRILCIIQCSCRGPNTFLISFQTFQSILLNQLQLLIQIDWKYEWQLCHHVLSCRHQEHHPFDLS